MLYSKQGHCCLVFLNADQETFCNWDPFEKTKVDQQQQETAVFNDFLSYLDKCRTCNDASTS